MIKRRLLFPVTLLLLLLSVGTSFLTGCSGKTDPVQTTEETTASAEPTSLDVTRPDEPISEGQTTAPVTEPETQPETQPDVWSPDVIAWYDVDNGSSGNTRPDHGWYFPYAETPGVATAGGIFRSATPLLGTYDQIEMSVARQHLYWLAQAGFTALAVDVTNVRSIHDPNPDMQFYYKGVYDHTEVLLAAAKSLCDEGMTNVPRIYVSVRLFGEDYDGLAAVLSEYRALYEKYPAQVWHRRGSDKPFVGIFVDHAVYNTWGRQPKTDVVDDFFDFRWTNGYIAGYGKSDGQGGTAISSDRLLWLFVENEKGKEDGSYKAIYTQTSDGRPECMVASVALHGGWNEDGSTWDAMNHLIDGKTPLDRTLGPIYAYRPEVVIIDRFNYPLVWLEQAQEGVGLYHSGHFEPCRELGFGMLYAVTRHAYALRSLTGEAPDAVMKGTCRDGKLFPDVSILPPEYRMGLTEDLSGTVWQMLSLENGMDYSAFTGVDTLYVQTRNAFGESAVTAVSVEKLDAADLPFAPFVFEFEPYGSESKYAKYGNAWVSADNFTMWMPADASGGAGVYASMHVDEQPNDAAAIVTTIDVTTSGTYRVALAYFLNSTCPVVQLYLDGQPLGEAIDLFGDSFKREKVTLATLPLTAGSHTLSIKSEKTNSGRWEIWLDALFFEDPNTPEGTPSLPTMTFEFEPHGDSSKYVLTGNAWMDSGDFTSWMPEDTSGGASFFCSMHVDGSPNPDSAISTVLTLDRAGTYALTLACFMNNSSPVIRLELDGQIISEPIDLNNNGSLTRITVPLGNHTLTAGAHTLRILSDESNSGKWEIWLDALTFAPAV